MNRRQLALALSALAGAGVAPFPAAAEPSPLLLSLVKSPLRNPKNAARDPFRHPAQSLDFWGLKPGMTVIEIDPAGGYWTEILAPYLRATGGKYVAAFGGDQSAFKTRFADAAVWGPMDVVDLSASSGALISNGSADLVLTSRNIHDWMWTPGLLDKFLADFHAALKPQGILAVEEHRADPRPMTTEARDGYVATAWLTNKVQSAGFVLASSSEINANPKDTKDHPFGVWTLPPTRRTHAKDAPTPEGFDPAKYEAIGESDRMTLRFTRA
jgi:predicted methyltransferase